MLFFSKKTLAPKQNGSSSVYSAGRDRKTKKILARRKSFLGPLFHSSLPQSSFLMFFSSDRYRSSLGSDRDANVFHFYIDNPSVNIIQYTTLGLLFEFLKSEKKIDIYIVVKSCVSLVSEICAKV